MVVASCLRIHGAPPYGNILHWLPWNTSLPATDLNNVLAETGKPIQKATGLQANFSIRGSTRRCRGHRQGHGVLQATFQGRNRTTLAAVYIKDFKKFATKNDQAYFIGYKCQKCALGKDAPPALVPRECRLVNFTSPCFSGGLQASGASMFLRTCKLQFELLSHKLDYPVRDLKFIPMLLKLSSGERYC